MLREAVRTAEEEHRATVFGYRVNGKVVFKGKPKTDLKYMAESIALYGDPRRVFPAAITVKY